jgi:LuxR family transcriptional regulator, maltose regulon positive regulatory protein
VRASSATPIAVPQPGGLAIDDSATDVEDDGVRPVVATKLHPPPVRPVCVRRSRLLEQLGESEMWRLTLISAPAGWGKTTLLADWYTQRSSRCDAWFSLDVGDNDPVRFWTGIVAALRAVVPDVGAETLAALGLPGSSDSDALLAPLLNEIAAFTEPLTLVVDDYHVIRNRDLQASVEYLVDRAPPTLRLVVASRVDPPLPLARLRARGELCELRAGDLSFSRPDAEEFLNDVLRLELPPADVSILWERTEGWASGLYLAALSLQDRVDRSGFIASFAGNHRHVVDYLGDEVLDRQSEETRRFLLYTSILDELSGPLCDAVLDTAGSNLVLEQLEQSNLFLQPLDTTREWYRYHRLFRDLLLHELNRAEPAVVPTLHRRAAKWHAQRGSVEAAIRHATCAADFTLAADLVTDHWYAFLQRGEVDTVAEWLKAFPPEVLAGEPRLCLTRAWIGINTGRLDDLDRWVDAAEAARGAGASADADATVVAGVAALRAIHRYMTGNVVIAEEAGRRADELARFADSPWRPIGCPVSGIAQFWAGSTTDAEQTLAHALDRGRQAGNHLAVLHGQGCQAVIHLERGEIRQANRCSVSALALADEHGLSEHWGTAMARVARGKVLELHGDGSEACATVERALELSRRGIASVEMAYASIELAQMLRTTGDDDSARLALADAGRAVAACPEPGILTDMIERARRARGRAPRGVPSSPELTDRERAVLRLLPGPLRREEMAAALQVSVNTAKTHLAAVYAKLGVSSRSDAVARARQLGLL